MKKITLVICGLFFTTTVYAHADYAVGGFTAGLLHPVLGFDHLLAMVSVGIISAQIGGKAIWQVPAVFLGMMLVGGITGIMGIPIPVFSVELGIASSVMVLGMAIATTTRLPRLFVMLFVSFFAIFHGHAHGIEIPDIARPELYVVGFIISTALLHIAGVVIGILCEKRAESEHVLRHVGSFIAGIGFSLIFLI